MSENSPAPRRILHLVVEGFPIDQLGPITDFPGANTVTEILPLTEATAKKALEDIFAADTVAVWTKLAV